MAQEQNQDQAAKLGRTLSALRQNLGKTQQQMAKQAGVSPSTYARHESGQEIPSAVLMECYVRELGILPVEFYRLHEILLRARARDAEGASWWMALEKTILETEREEINLRAKLLQFSALQADIWDALLRRLDR